MDTRSWHYPIWKWCTLALRPRTFQLPTRVNILDYWLTVICSPLIGVLWVGQHVLTLAVLSLIYVVVTLVNFAIIPFGRTFSYRTLKVAQYRPLFRIYRQRVYPIHLVCALVVLAAFVGMNALFIFPPEGRNTSLFLWIMMDLMFNTILLLLTAGLLSTHRIGKRLNAYLRYRYRHLPIYTFDRKLPVNATN